MSPKSPGGYKDRNGYWQYMHIISYLRSFSLIFSQTSNYLPKEVGSPGAVTYNTFPHPTPGTFDRTEGEPVDRETSTWSIYSLAAISSRTIIFVSLPELRADFMKSRRPGVLRTARPSSSRIRIADSMGSHRDWWCITQDKQECDCWNCKSACQAFSFDQQRQPNGISCHTDA